MVVARRISAVDVYVGRRLRMARLSKDFSQEKLGDALGLTFQQVQKYEKGANRIGAGRLHAIAKILSVPISYFFDGVGQTGQRTDRGIEIDALTEALITPEGIRIARALAQVREPETRRSVADLLEAVVSIRSAKARLDRD